MKKRLLLLPFLSLTGLMVAEEMLDSELERITNEAKVVVYTITIYRDSTKGIPQEWPNIVRNTLNSIKSTEKDDTWVLDLCKSLVETHKESDASGDKRVHGEIRISLGNGECPQGRCATPCPCKENYRGVCICSAGQSSCCE